MTVKMRGGNGHNSLVRSFISLLLIQLHILRCGAEPLPLVGRGPPTTCQLPELQPLIQSLANNFPKSAVNSFCSSVVGTKGLPRTTTTSFKRTTVTETYTDTYSATILKRLTGSRQREFKFRCSFIADADDSQSVCVTRLRPREEPTIAPRQKNGQSINAVANSYKAAPRILTQACQCLLPTITKTAVAKETHTSYDYTDTTLIFTTTATVTKALPTFIAQIRAPNSSVDNYYLQSGATDDDQGNFVFNVLTAVKSKNLATTFSLTCEGFLLQTNTSTLGNKRLLSDTSFTSGQSPVYFDEASLVDYSEDGHNFPPLICQVNNQLLQCRAVTPQRNRWQYCPSYEEFFATGVLLTGTVGPNCMLFDVITSPK